MPVGAAAMLPVIWSLTVTLLRRVLRLGGAGGRRGPRTHAHHVPAVVDGAELGETERSIIAKYGGDAEGDELEGGEEDDGEGESEDDE